MAFSGRLIKRTQKNSCRRKNTPLASKAARVGFCRSISSFALKFRPRFSSAWSSLNKPSIKYVTIKGQMRRTYPRWRLLPEEGNTLKSNVRKFERCVFEYPFREFLEFFCAVGGHRRLNCQQEKTSQEHAFKQNHGIQPNASGCRNTFACAAFQTRKFWIWQRCSKWMCAFLRGRP